MGKILLILSLTGSREKLILSHINSILIQLEVECSGQVVMKDHYYHLYLRGCPVDHKRRGGENLWKEKATLLQNCLGKAESSSVEFVMLKGTTGGAAPKQIML